MCHFLGWFDLCIQNLHKQKWSLGAAGRCVEPCLDDQDFIEELALQR